VARCLEELGHELVVADPNFAAMYATRSRRVKTDRRDARTLAEACKLGAYRPAHRTSDRQRQVRAQLAVREALVQTRSRYISLVGALLRREGLRVATGNAEGFGKRVERLALPGRLKSEIAPLRAVLLSVNRQLDWVDSRLGQLVQTDETVARLCTGLRAIQTRPTSPRARRAAGRNSPSLRSAAQLVSRLAPADRVRFGETDPGDPPQLSEPLEHRRRRGTGSAKLIVRLRR
jgi:hypothetical protein